MSAIDMTGIDLRCYFITGNNAGTDPVAVAREAVAGGCRMIQVRSKPISARDLYELGARMADAVGDTATVVIDDRLDVALALRAEGHRIAGVHLGQDDLDVRLARKLLGPDAVIGLTTGTLGLVEAANSVADAIDCIGAGPFRPTPTKESGRPTIGLEGYPTLVRASRVPVVAIGDVTADDAADLAATGVAGVAVVRGFMNAANPRAYAEKIVKGFA